jgi:hypothetical protein
VSEPSQTDETRALEELDLPYVDFSSEAYLADPLEAATAPEVFAFDAEDRLVIVQPTPDPDLRAKVEDAVDGCPRAALSIVDS